MSGAKPATLSIIVPLFNAEPHEIGQALASLVPDHAARHGEVEIVLVDDGSSMPPDLSIAKHQVGADRWDSLQIRLLTHPQNRGLAAARNTGMAAATGRYVVLLDADDWLLPGQIDHLLDRLKDETADLVYLPSILTASKAASAPLDRQEQAICALAGESITPSDASRFAVMALTKSSWSMAYRRRFLQQSGLGFDPVLRRWEDRPFYLKSQLAAETAAVLPDPVRAYYVGSKPGGSITRRAFDRNDVWMMCRHVRQVHEDLDRDARVRQTDFAVTHFWLSVWRFCTIVLGGTTLLLLRDRRAGKLAFGTATWLAVHGGELASRQPHHLSQPGKLPFWLLRSIYLAMRHSASWMGASVLVLMGFGFGARKRIRDMARWISFYTSGSRKPPAPVSKGS
ncbi:MAG: glycosyltransferase family 2 protein [Hyphomicrobiaceae bacterium]|nr:glycosyltransferase family 2 protein [Hyphomicrobiaceae bacterium]MCC0022745.1 glycosyltransferase family 2 protein [Hyphomicrobiaceae bacterium]